MSEFKLNTEKVKDAEIVHHVSVHGIITSSANMVRCKHAKSATQTFVFKQTNWKKLGLPFRMGRRLLRLDKVVVVPVEKNQRWIAMIVVRGGACYHVDLETETITKTLTLRQSRNPLHQSVCRSDRGWFYQGEYGLNPQRVQVPVYRSVTDGRTWETVYEFQAGRARHVHGSFWDPFEQSIWVCTGDYENENHILVADENFENLEWLGDGTQSWRTCHLMFTEHFVYWGMDSELETSHICRLDRKSREMVKLRAMPGPIWYAKLLNDGWLLVASVVEQGSGVHDDHAHIFASRNGEDWYDVYHAKKDIWKMPQLKNGVINFADGEQSSHEFYFSAEALQGLDGKVIKASLVEI